MAGHRPPQSASRARRAARKSCAKIEPAGESAPAARRKAGVLRIVDLANSCGHSRIGIQQLLQARGRAGKDGRPVGEEHSLRFAGQKFSERSPHLFFVRAIFARKKSESVGLKIDQRIADNERAAIWGVIKRQFTGDRTVNLDDLKVVVDLCAVSDLNESRRLFILKRVAVCENRRGKLV